MFNRVAATLICFSCACSPLLAADGDFSSYPTKTIRIIVGFLPSGGNDTLARIVGQKLFDRLGHPVIVDNRTGAGGNLAAELAAKAPADGYTILMASSSHPIQGLIKKNLPYDPIKDFAGVAQLVTYQSVLVVRAGLTATTVRELVAFAKSMPGRLTYASAGNGSGSHLTGELFKSAAQINMTHVPYRGGAQGLTDLMAGQVDVMIPPLVGSIMPYVKEGRLRAIAVTSDVRSRLLPDLPTISEAGVSGYYSVAWNGILAPAATPRRIIKKLNAAITEVMQLPDVKSRLESDGMDIVRRGPEEFDVIRSAEISKWSKIIERSGIRMMSSAAFGIRDRPTI